MPAESLSRWSPPACSIPTTTSHRRHVGTPSAAIPRAGQPCSRLSRSQGSGIGVKSFPASTISRAATIFYVLLAVSGSSAVRDRHGVLCDEGHGTESGKADRGTFRITRRRQALGHLAPRRWGRVVAKHNGGITIRLWERIEPHPSAGAERAAVWRHSRRLTVGGKPIRHARGHTVVVICVGASERARSRRPDLLRRPDRCRRPG